MQRMKRQGDMRSPFLIPLERLNLVVLEPLMTMGIEEEEIQDIIRLVIDEENLKYKRVSLMKDHSRLSKSFSKSILRIMLPCLHFILLK